jgi:cation diffusion facilitator family transporter
MGDHGHAHGGGKNHQEEDDWKKIVSFWSIGLLTAAYCIVEVAAGVYLSSLTLLSDAFHNLSDVASLYIAYWALKAARRDSGDEMTYGWARTELIGGLINGCALLSLCIYIVLEAIPRYISAASDDGSNCSDPSHLSVSNDKMFVYVAAGGLAVNTIGTIMFAGKTTNPSLVLLLLSPSSASSSCLVPKVSSPFLSLPFSSFSN